MRRQAGMCATLLLAILACVAGRGPESRAEDRGFAAAPLARMRDGLVEISFALTEPTDFAVFVKDDKGRTVRHLAARAASEAAQRLTWDGCDDEGRPVSPGAYRIEVALGLKPAYEATFGSDPRELGAVHGLAVGPKGDLYVMGGEGRVDRFQRFAVFSARGEYRRTIVPRPSGLPIERVTPLSEVVLDNGERFPMLLLPEYGGPMDQAPVVAPNGDLIFANGSMMYHAERHRFRAAERMQPVWPRRLLRLAADGGAPEAGYLGPVLGKGFDKRTLYLALAPDGETVYISGAQDAVFKARWGEAEQPVALVGVPGTPGAGAKNLKDPCGIAVDVAGNLYVADRGNHRIVCFDPKGAYVGELAVEWPLLVAVHPKAGTVYAVTGFREYRLVKFADLRTPKPVTELALSSSRPVLALDARGAQAVLYVGNVDRRDLETGSVRGAVVRLVDGGERFGDGQVVTRASEAPLGPGLLGIDREAELVYGGSSRGYVRWDGRTGAVEPVPMRQHPKASNASTMTAAADGTLAFRVPGEVGRVDRRLLPVPFASSLSYIARLLKDDPVLTSRGNFIAPDGTIYLHSGHNQPTRVSALKNDGTPSRERFIVVETCSSAGMRVDREGNVYMLDHVKPVGQPVPDVFQGKVPVERHSPYVYHYGSVLKIGPQGGAIRELGRKAPVTRDLKPGQFQFTTAEGRGDYVSDGVQWAWYGVSMIAPWLDRGAYPPYNCLCKTPEFDLDDFARVFVPDQLRCRIVVLDTNGRFITAFGRYGNIDERGPDLAFADPRTVVVSHEAAYVGDERNDRIVKVRLDYRERAACTVELPQVAVTTEAARRLREAEASCRELRAEVEKLSPALAKALDWAALARRMTARSQNQALDDARAELCVTAPRDVEDWPDEEARALLGGYLKSGSERVRTAVVWGLADGRLSETGRDLLREALADKAESVRIAAAVGLLDREDPAGLVEVFRGALAQNQDVYKLAETSFLKQLLVWDASDPRAKAVDNETALVPAYPMDRDAVLALGNLLDRTETWYLRRSAMFLLALSGDAEAGPPLLRAMRRPERDRNLNRCIGGLGLLRYREAVPDLLKYLARGQAPNWGTEQYNGDQAHVCAALALVRIADPEMVAPIIALVDSEKPEVRVLARRALTDLFAVDVPPDRCLVPKGNAFEQVRVDALPRPADLRALWEAFWKVNRALYAWPNPGPPLRGRETGKD